MCIRDRARAEEESREEQTDESQYHETLLSALTSLPEMQREALILYYYDELSIREIARITETNAATVKSRPVSYTNLDVYKRQPYAEVCISISGH